MLTLLTIQTVNTFNRQRFKILSRQRRLWIDFLSSEIKVSSSQINVFSSDYDVSSSQGDVGSSNDGADSSVGDVYSSN